MTSQSGKAKKNDALTKSLYFLVWADSTSFNSLRLFTFALGVL
jgi:hypothetical protein